MALASLRRTSKNFYFYFKKPYWWDKRNFSVIVIVIVELLGEKGSPGNVIVMAAQRISDGHARAI